MLAAEPCCTECSVKLGDVPPAADMRRVIAAIEQGLGLQQERLARHVVARILAQTPSTGDDQVERFLQVVQASDLDGLAHVIDDGLLRSWTPCCPRTRRTPTRWRALLARSPL